MFMNLLNFSYESFAFLLLVYNKNDKKIKKTGEKMNRLENKVAIITGASQGLGAAMAERFMEEGAVVYNFDIQEGHNEAIFMPVDITREDSIQEAVNTVMENEGHIDILVNNAGIIRDALVNKMTDDAWDSVLDVNLKGAFLMTKAVLPHFYAQEEGSIINISSIVGEYGNIGQSNYVATKAGIIGLTYTWAKEFTRKGANIRTNAVAPGYADTEMMQSVPEKILNHIIETNPLKRLASPRDIANAALFLASDEASYINGQVLGVNGGARL